MTTPAKTLEQSATMLMEKIVDPDNLVRAWNKVRSNGGAPGPDGITIDDFPDHLYDDGNSTFVTTVFSKFKVTIWGAGLL
jgi:hypothetical protein